ncbi:MAG TPA: ABC transporter substrate-binding protein [Ktedonobacterales bacterium]|nr:ABC transporter substrate-binding protein [Ktedonobacterales bacterium]
MTPRPRISSDFLSFLRRRPAPGRSASPLLMLAVLAVLLLAGCGGNGNTSSSGGPKTGGTLTVGLDSDVVTLDPLKSTALVDREAMFNIYDTLVRSDQKNNIQPDLATSWTYSTPTQLEFTLRSDVKFQDGTPFNADAVVFNINRILNTPSSPRNSELATVASVTKVDDTHVTFNLKKPFSPLLATLSDRAGMMLSPAVVQAQGDSLGNNPAKAGTGPFEFSSWVKGDHLTFTRNPNYWQKDSSGHALPYLNSVVYKPITNGSVRFTNLETGAINVAEDLDPTDVPSAKTNSSLVYNQIPGLSFYGIELNTQAAPFNNVHLRRAVEWGVNRQEILTSVLHGIGVVSQGPISPSSWAYDSSFAPYSYDQANAKSELQQGGQPNGFSFTMLIASGSPLNTQLAQFIQSELQPIGIKVTIQQETFAKLLSDSAAHNYQAANLGWSGRVDPDGNTYAWFHTGGGFNDMQYTNPQVDALLEDARASSDQSKRTSDYQQADKLILQDGPYVFLYHGVAVQATTSNVKNFVLLPTTIMVFTTTYLAS